MSQRTVAEALEGFSGLLHHEERRIGWSRDKHEILIRSQKHNYNFKHSSEFSAPHPPTTTN